MIRGLRRHTGGFTILETIIVLSVMIVLLTSTLALFQQRVPRTQFAKAVNELNVQITDIINQVSSGNYPNSGNFKCEVTSGTPALSTGTPLEQGTNQDCIFIGQAIKFGKAGAAANCVNEECDNLKIFTVFGSRKSVSGTGIADSIVHANAKIDESLATQDYTTGYGLGVTKVKLNSPSGDEYAGVAYVQSFGARINASGDPNGAPQVSLVPLLRSQKAGIPNVSFVSEVNKIPNIANTWAVQNPPEGILVCLKSGTSNQYAVLILGANGNASSVERKIMDQTEWNYTYQCA